MPRPKRQPAKGFRYVEIVLETGLHIKVHPQSQRCFLWIESDNGFMMDYSEHSIEDVLEVLAKVKAERTDSIIEADPQA